MPRSAKRTMAVDVKFEDLDSDFGSILSRASTSQSSAGSSYQGTTPSLTSMSSVCSPTTTSTSWSSDPCSPMFFEVTQSPTSITSGTPPPPWTSTGPNHLPFPFRSSGYLEPTPPIHRTAYTWPMLYDPLSGCYPYGDTSSMGYSPHEFGILPHSLPSEHTSGIGYWSEECWIPSPHYATVFHHAEFQRASRPFSSHHHEVPYVDGPSEEPHLCLRSASRSPSDRPLILS